MEHTLRISRSASLGIGAHIITIDYVYAGTSAACGRPRPADSGIVLKTGSGLHPAVTGEG